jgi:hypothetical protein
VSQTPSLTPKAPVIKNAIVFFSNRNVASGVSAKVAIRKVASGVAS